MRTTVEHRRLDEARDGQSPWKMWGPYLSERQWGTVREDYSESGDSWNFFPHDHARSRAYRWGEDGLAGFSDERQLLCFAVALWNGKDPILKERLFGLGNAEGNHGEDVKEYYYYLDSTPTHSYMKYLYKYPQSAYPYHDLVATNRSRSKAEFEYELLDTGVFDDGRYFDVFVEYAKESPDEILIQITIVNRGNETATLSVLPTLWFRNTWNPPSGRPKPALRRAEGETSAVLATHEQLGEYFLTCDRDVPLLFTENETNARRLFGQPNPTQYVKDGINDSIVDGTDTGINAECTGTKVAAHYQVDVKAGAQEVIRLRLGKKKRGAGAAFDKAYEKMFADRLAEADEFYAAVSGGLSEDRALVFRQALAGTLWSKQFYNFDLHEWLAEHGDDALSGIERAGMRNRDWFHMINEDVISMPDKWEYPWYAAWDLAFHAIPLAMVDMDFAKHQLEIMLSELYMHPNGQIPAYEWNFNDVNPPVHAFAAKMVYDMEKAETGKGDAAFLSRVFQKLAVNFTWWVNRKDRSGKNIFEGGFLGLDNIGIFDRSSPLPTGGFIEQADGTGWMAFYALSMLDIASELATVDATYQGMALKFAEHFMWIAIAMFRSTAGHDSLWDAEDGFFYDVLRLPDGRAERLKVRSLVGLLPMCAVFVLDDEFFRRAPQAVERLRMRIRRQAKIADVVPNVDVIGQNGTRLLALLDEQNLRRVLSRLLDENEFWGPHGVRSLSRSHLDHPYKLNVDGKEFSISYVPAESDSGTFGGNSNWRGPVWMPLNALIVRALTEFHRFYGDDFKIECPTGSGSLKTLLEVAVELTERLESIFLRESSGARPVFGGIKQFREDPNWRDNILFYEYFHGDNGAGIGASHQTGWTALIAYFIRRKSKGSATT
jgi:hypothetical protein